MLLSNRKLLITLLLAVGVLAFVSKKPLKRAIVKVVKPYIENKHEPELVSAGSGRPYVWGIDISHHQKSVLWDTLVLRNKPDFIFLKATEGSTHVDSKYAAYQKKSREYKIPVGAYHFFSYQTSGKTQAANFIKHANLKKGDLIPVLDVEFRKNMQTKEWNIAEIKAFCKEIKQKYGVNPIIYCECDYYKKYLQKDFDDYHYWISDLYREPRCNYVFWQYTDKGLVHGIGKIDNNRLHPNKKLSDFKLSLKKQ